MRQLVTNIFALLILGSCFSIPVFSQDSLRKAWQAQIPDIPGPSFPLDTSQFAWTSKLDMPLPGVPNHGWMVVSVRTDSKGAFMGHCFAVETNTGLDQWLLDGLRNSLFQDSSGNPLEGWTAIQFGFCLPCGETQLQSLKYTPYSQSKSVNGHTAPEPTEFAPGIQKITPLGFLNFAKTIPYPSALIEQGIEGKVYLQIRVDQFGRYMEHKVLRSPHPQMSRAVEGRIKDLRFLPAIYKDGRGKGWITLPFHFRLN